MGDFFARRHGYRVRREIRIREDAPAELRLGVAALFHERGLTYTQIREFVCAALHAVPDPDNWTEVPNVRDEVIALVQRCEWFRIYDICEAGYRYLQNLGQAGFPPIGDPRPPADEFANRLNELLEELGIGWQMIGGQIVTRGPEEFERIVNQAVEVAREAGHRTPTQELEEARRDLSRRPEPDITGTVQHCIAALECTARIVSGDEGATLGQIIRRHAADLGIPRPLDSGVENIWGYASEMGRHLREGRLPSRDEAELLLNISASLVNYLTNRNRVRD